MYTFIDFCKYILVKFYQIKWFVSGERKYFCKVMVVCCQMHKVFAIYYIVISRYCDIAAIYRDIAILPQYIAILRYCRNISQYRNIFDIILQGNGWSVAKCINFMHLQYNILRNILRYCNVSFRYRDIFRYRYIAIYRDIANIISTLIDKCNLNSRFQGHHSIQDFIAHCQDATIAILKLSNIGHG